MVLAGRMHRAAAVMGVIAKGGAGVVFVRVTVSALVVALAALAAVTVVSFGLLELESGRADAAAFCAKGALLLSHRGPG